MYSKHCEQLANSQSGLKLVIEKVDEILHQDQNAVLIASTFEKAYNVKHSHITSVLKELEKSGLLVKANYLVCPSKNCENLNELGESECSICGTSLSTDICTTESIYKLNPDCKEETVTTGTKENLILFIHGLGGAPESTWKKFPKLLNKHSDIASDHDIAHYSFPTGWGRTFSFCRKGNPRIDTLAEGLRTEIENKYCNHKRIRFICHSLGGLIARKYLVDELKRSSKCGKVDKSILFATPNNGSDLGKVVKLIPIGFTQIKQLCKNSEFIDSLNKDWAFLKAEANISVKYVIGAMDRIVDLNSARANWNTDFDTIADKGHLDIVKPATVNDLSVVIAQKFILD
jgi:pimeloyl-ACP methyl ester carboxylesterase